MMYNFDMCIVDKKAADAVKKFCAERKIVVALSGGRDSVCLLDMLCRYGKSMEISALHVNHNLRPESKEEESFVKKLCSGYGIPLEVFEIDVLGSLDGRSVETAAREMRRDIYKKFTDEGKKVALAHHALDRAETVLMHILRGSGVDGLVGMSERDGDLIRPILDFMPEELDEYVALHKLEFVTDCTNFDSTYDRNFVRLQVLPLLSQRYPAVKSLIRLSENAAKAEAFAKNYLDYSVVKISADEARIKVCDLIEPYSAYKYVLFALNGLGLKKDYTSANIESVLSLCKSQSGARFSFLGIEAIREFDFIRIFRCDNKIQSTGANSCRDLQFCEGVFDFCGKKVSVKRQTQSEYSALKKSGSCHKNGSNDDGLGKKNELGDNGFNNKILFIDGDKIPPDAVIRLRRDGDVFRPYASGEKKLKKYLIDKKIPLSKRDSLPLLAVNSRVLAVFGVEISNLVKCEETSENIFEIKVSD